MTQRTSRSQRQLATLQLHWNKCPGQSPDDRHERENSEFYFGKVGTHLAVTGDDYVKTKTVYEAKQGGDWDQWCQGMKDEFKTLQDNDTWKLVRPPIDMDAITGKWVYKLKLGPNCQVDKYNASYAAENFKQVESLYYFETFSPTCKPENFWIPLQLTAKQIHVMRQFDVKTAFLCSSIEEEVCLVLIQS